jgi:uncharacterized PurR-regulated membrane protein YhhQ (DUF165 family)
MIPEGPLFHKPKSILAARNILYASLFLAVIGLFVVQFALGLPGNPNLKVILSNGSLIILLYIAIRFIGFGKKWARTMFLVVFILNAVATPIYASFIFRTNLALGFLFVLQMLLQILALVYLYSESSNEWFNRFESLENQK